jgi:hypothetical protein
MASYRWLALAPFIALSACSSNPIASDRKPASPEPLSWVELGPGSEAIARTIVAGSDCPKLEIDHHTAPMLLRSAPSNGYPVRVCDAVIPPGTQHARIGDQVLALPNPNPKKILFMGDTGCRVSVKNGKTEIQACNDPKAWPFPSMSKTESEWKPDLVVHVGDYLYRESPCPAGNNGCSGSPAGQNWDTWSADFFQPAKPLLEAAPWIMVRGNHESCSRAGDGWFRFLEPRPAIPCTDDTAPYWIQYGPLQFVVMDSGLATDLAAPADQVKMYKGQFEAIARMPLEHAWLLTHKPIWAPAFRDRHDLKSSVEYFNLTLQTASDNRLPQGIDAVFAGHLHLFEEINFADGRPTQLVVGNGGTKRTSPPMPDPTGASFAGTTVTSGKTLDDFGYFTLEKRKGGWIGTAYDGQGVARLECREKAKRMLCSDVAR